MGAKFLALYCASILDLFSTHFGCCTVGCCVLLQPQHRIGPVASVVYFYMSEITISLYSLTKKCPKQLHLLLMDCTQMSSSHPILILQLVTFTINARVLSQTPAQSNCKNKVKKIKLCNG